jgi:proteic killer suppression protein
LDILFASKKLEQLCHDEKLATRTLGAPSARKLRARLDDLIAAANLDYMRKLPGRFHGLSKNRTGQFALDLQGGCRLVLEPANGPLPKRPDGTLDLTKVTTIKVVEIGDYHD